MSRNWIIAGVAAVCFITGVALSHLIEPGVRVEENFHFSNSGVINIITVVSSGVNTLSSYFQSSFTLHG